VTAGVWTADELDGISDAQELEIAPRRRDGSLDPPLPIWVVRVRDDLYVRSWRGSAGHWFRAAQRTHEAHVSAGGVDADVTLLDAEEEATNDAVDAAYRAKYGRYSSYVEPMIAPQARATTLKLVPLDRGGAA